MTSLLYRTVKNQPWNENIIRGIETDNDKGPEGVDLIE